MPIHNLQDVEQLLDAVGAKRDETAEQKNAEQLANSIRDEAYTAFKDANYEAVVDVTLMDEMPVLRKPAVSTLDGGIPTRAITMEEARELFPEPSLQEQLVEEIAIEHKAKQGDPNWHRRSPMEKAMKRFQIRQQLEHQKQQRDKQKALDAWRRKHNADRMDLGEVAQAAVAAGISIGHARTANAIRGAMQYAGYKLGL